MRGRVAGYGLRAAGNSKPLGRKAYGSIPHLPGSRLGPGDHHCHPGQARICTEKSRDKYDSVTVTVKLDGSCCAVAKIGGEIVALGRAGWLAATSPYEQHRLFASWVASKAARFDSILGEGERIVGEWLAQAHGTRYDLGGREPFVAFDLFDPTNRRIPHAEFRSRAEQECFATPTILNAGRATIETALFQLGQYYRSGGYGELDEPEGVVWRVERKGTFDFLAKYVRPDKIDGCYLPKEPGEVEIWNWQPSDQPINGSRINGQ